MAVDRDPDANAAAIDVPPEARPPGRWVGFLLLGIAVFLLPWTFWLTQTLPARHVSEHWRAAWTGFDLVLAGALVLTAVGVVRRAAWLQASAAATAAMLLCDAWFDTLLSRHTWIAFGEAAFSEVPLALFLLWVAYNTTRFRAPP
jgi:hypothetical protein